MVAIITGDIINSRETAPQEWLNELKAVLNLFGNEPKSWEIYRGDSFQLEVSPKEALKAAFLIKASIKQFKHNDVRLAIGIGEKRYASEKITESNGSAFVNSGLCFEQLKKHTLAVKSPSETFDYQLNLMLELALLVMDQWKPATSTILKYTLTYPTLNQEAIAQKLQKSQSNISEGLKRGGYDELSKLLAYYESQIQSLC
ncbi:transcriptional regulator [Psychroserpens sp. SPM9]|uniref:transcriptional regulator n=1 Tax=Psychroserpens sp. SPM9 TaxID=2975598 RepID=UPI0021A2DC2A|nr:transcriptional regulator [Psychroserpens sp. SPM9]MDG5493171.1 transcriptional regulator [Psychroserpens sp. SPM9]